MSKDDQDRFDQAIMAWHASPYDLPDGKFGPMRKVSGTGQGQAMYGRGVAYVAENPKVSGPGESEYMREFASHEAVSGRRQWQIRSMDDHNEWLGLNDDSYDDDAIPDAIYRPRHDFGRSWVLSYLSNHGVSDEPSALGNLKDMLSTGREGHKVDPDNFPSPYEHLVSFMNQHREWVPQDDDTEFDDNHGYHVAKYLDQHADKELRFNDDGGTSGPFSYRVAVHLKPETMLDWDSGLSDHHVKALDKFRLAHGAGMVKAGTEPGPHSMERFEMGHGSNSGAQFYHNLTTLHGSDLDASEALYNAGIHGIRYRDAGSRNPKPALHIDGHDLGGYFQKLHADGVNLNNISDESRHELDMFTTLSGEVEHDWRLHGLSKAGLLKYYEDKATNARQMAEDELNTADDFGKTVEQVKNSTRYEEMVRAADRAESHSKWLKENADRLEMRYPKPTYNYVIFHPDFVEALAQYNIKGEKVKDYGPGVHLKAVDHDPFKGEDK